MIYFLSIHNFTMKSKNYHRIIKETTPEIRQKVKDFMDKKDLDVKECNHPEHNFPILLYIPGGQTHTHVCPNCGNEITVMASIVSL